MATTSSKLRSDHRNLSKSNSLSTPKHNADASNLKPSPNYLKPTMSSRGDPVNSLSKRSIAHGLHDSQKLLRRRSFDPTPSTSSSPRLHKSLDISPLRPRHRPSLPSEKPLTPLRSSSFYATRSSSSTAAKSPPVAPRRSKKSGLSNSSSNTKSLSKKAPHTRASQESPREEEKEVLKVATNEVQEEDKEEPEAEAVHPDEPTEENKEVDETDASPDLDSLLVTKTEPVDDDKRPGAEEDNREGQKVIDADEAKEKAETAPEEDDQDDRAPEAGNISTDVATVTKTDSRVRESTAEQEKEGGKEMKEEESSDSKEEKASKTMTIAVSPDGPKRQVAQGKKESPSAYNDVIEKTASKLLENRKNKVKALVGAFETVIDYETAASK